MTLIKTDSIRSFRIDTLYAVWLQKANGRPAPMRSDFDLPFDIRPIIGSVAMTEKVDTGLLHRVYGSRLVELFGVDWTGKPLSDYRDHGAGWAVDMVEAVYADGRPRHGFHTIDWQGRDHIRFEWICLPLADAAGRVTMTLGAIDVAD